MSYAAKDSDSDATRCGNTVEVESTIRTAWRAFNETEKRNAMSSILHREMFEDMKADDDAKVPARTGAGDPSPTHWTWENTSWQSAPYFAAKERLLQCGQLCLEWPVVSVHDLQRDKL